MSDDTETISDTAGIEPEGGPTFHGPGAVEAAAKYLGDKREADPDAFSPTKDAHPAEEKPIRRRAGGEGPLPKC